MPGHPSPWATTCPRCGREASLTLLAAGKGKKHAPITWLDPEMPEGNRVSVAWEQATLYQCPTCQGFTLRTILTEHEDGSGLSRPMERLPFGSPKPMTGLPPIVSGDRDDAWRAFHGTLFKGAALLARSSLESAVKTRGAAGQDLKAKIKDLATKGAITQDLAAWADEIRITGNEAAHEMGPVSEDDASESLYFLDAFLDVVYVVPNRHRERKARREAKVAEPAAKDESTVGGGGTGLEGSKDPGAGQLEPG